MSRTNFDFSGTTLPTIFGTAAVMFWLIDTILPDANTLGAAIIFVILAFVALLLPGVLKQQGYMK